MEADEGVTIVMIRLIKEMKDEEIENKFQNRK